MEKETSIYVYEPLLNSLNLFNKRKDKKPHFPNAITLVPRIIMGIYILN